MARLNRSAPVTSGPEAELSGLLASQASLRDRQTGLTAETETAVARRRELLISGNDAAGLADAERTCRELEGNTFAVLDALAEIDRRIGDCRVRIEAANETAARNATAAGLERDAGAIVTATKAVTDAVAALAKAHRGLATAITGTAAAIHDPRLDTSPTGLASALMLGALVEAVPSLNIVDGEAIRHPAMPPARILPDSAAMKAEVLAGALREKAEAVRSGEAPVSLPAFETVVPIVQAPHDEVQAYVSVPFYYWRGTSRTMVTPSFTSLPVPVAERAIELGYASREPDAAWRRFERDPGPASLTTHSYGWDDATDLDFDLDAHRAAESVRLTAEARAAA